MMNAPHRIAVWNTAFLGDAVLTLPLLRVLRAAWPDARLDFYVRGGLAGLFTAQPELDHVYACDKRGAARGLTGFGRLAREIASRRYDVWIDAHLSLRSSLMARLSGAAVRVGYAEAAMGWWMLNRRVGRRFGQREEIERLLGLLEALELPDAVWTDESLRWPELALPAAAHAEAARLLAPLPPGPVLGLHPGSVWPTKRWTPEGFARVLRLALASGTNVALLASPDECGTLREVLRLAETDGRGGPGLTALAAGPGGSSRLLDLGGKTSLPGLAAVVGRVQCCLTNDSGPMHLAWAQRTPVTALFGPTVRGLGFFPRGDSTVVETDEPCRPCGLHGHRKCPQGHFRCMRNIDPERVWDDVRRKLYPWKEAESSRRARRPDAGGEEAREQEPAGRKRVAASGEKDA